MSDQHNKFSLNSRSKMALQIAYLLSKDKSLSQEQIKNILGLKHQSDVHRLIKFAEQNKWLREIWQINWPVGPAAQLAIISEIEIQKYEKTSGLEQSLINLAVDRKGVIPNLYIINDSAFPKDLDSRRREFGWRAAEYVRNLLATRDKTTMAIAWGEGVKAVVSAIGSKTPSENFDVRFVPMAGTPWTQRLQNIQSTSSYLVSEMAKKFDPLETDVPSLEGIPVRIPESMQKESNIIRAYLATSADYKRIFVNDGSGSGLMDKVDLVLAGIGDTKTSKNDPTFMELEEMEPNVDISMYSHGNIGGIWLPIDENNSSHTSVINGINERWLGMSRAQLDACVDRSHKKMGAGVVIVAMEAAKVNILYSTIGYANHIIITKTLAEALAQGVASPR